MAEASFIRSQLLANHGITGVFTLRGGGVSPPPFDSQNFGPKLGDKDSNIAQNLHALIESACLPSMPHQAMQVHKTDLLWCSGQGHMHLQQADILISDQPDTAIAVRVADCLPILLADPETSMVAAVHAGWRGTATDIANKAVQAMIRHGADCKNILAALGPCIGPCCFAIGQGTADALEKSVAGTADLIVHTSDMHANLSEINRLQLLQSGLNESHIEPNRACTACDPERFFSFRRDGQATGRQLAVVAIPSST